MSPRTGRPTSDPKNNRLEVRLTGKQDEDLEEMKKRIGTSKTEILMRGLELVKLQKANREFEDLSNCLILRELQNDNPLTPDDKREISAYIDTLKRKYDQ